LLNIPQMTFKEFGGPLLGKSHAKRRRSISLNRRMHFVFRSSQAVGNYSFLNKKNRRIILSVLRQHKFLVQIKHFSIGYQEVHLVCKARERIDLNKFLRVFSGLVARKILHAEKASPRLKKKKFWNFRPYSRVLKGLLFKPNDLKKIRPYLQAIGAIPMTSINTS